jgi:HSF-type DNA-binding
MANADRKVQHNYRDHANITDNMSGLAGNNELAHSASDRNFPVKLHFMLNELESDGLSHIVSWQPHGRCFVVHKQEDFVKTILPMYVRGKSIPQCEPFILLSAHVTFSFQVVPSKQVRFLSTATQSLWLQTPYFR